MGDFTQTGCASAGHRAGEEPASGPTEVTPEKMGRHGAASPFGGRMDAMAHSERGLEGLVVDCTSLGAERMLRFRPRAGQELLRVDVLAIRLLAAPQEEECASSITC